MDIRTLVNRYADSLRAAGRRPLTIRLHLHYLSEIARLGELEDITTEKLEKWLARAGWSAETRKSARGVARSFFRWCHGNGFIEIDPARNLAPVRVPPGVPRPVSDEMFEDALAKADKRTRLMILFAAKAGLRASEIAALNKADFDGVMLHVTGKGGRVRSIPVVDTRLKLALLNADPWVFPSFAGHIGAGVVTKAVSAVLPRGWTCHKLRHRFASQAYAGTHDLLSVQKLLGHSSPATTQRYVATPQDALIAAVRAAA